MLELNPPKVHPIERMLVAVPDFSNRGNATIISYQGVAIDSDIDAICSNSVDEIGVSPPDENGLWIWEGIPIWHRTFDYEGNEDGEMDYSGGKWRRPTIEELQQIQNGESIWGPTFLCADCLHEQLENKPCEVCNSVKVVSTEIVEEHFGRDWRDKIEYPTVTIEL